MVEENKNENSMIETQFEQKNVTIEINNINENNNITENNDNFDDINNNKNGDISQEKVIKKISSSLVGFKFIKPTEKDLNKRGKHINKLMNQLMNEPLLNEED